MFSYRKYDIEIVRNIEFERLAWPKPAEAADDSGLGLNRQYMDLRRMPWSEAKRVFEVESELIERIEISEEPDEAYDTIEDEIFDKLDGLDLGVASTVIALSAARCIPFSSCNAGVFGGHHRESHPLVAFYARRPIAELVLACAYDSIAGLQTNENGCLVAYADDIRVLRQFAKILIQRRNLFRDLRTPRKPKGDKGPDSGQLPLL